MKKLTLGFSPCPNDTFIFDALVHHKIDTQGFDFEVTYDDVETLNQKAFRGELDITKLSYHAFAYALDQYELLDAGSALGFGVGPLLICKDRHLAQRLHQKDLSLDVEKLSVGIPGKFTTANFLLSLAYPQLQDKREILFSEIESALQNDQIDLGLIIHENRFTYQQKGLHKVRDLGDFWESLSGFAIPLGGIVIKRSLPPETKNTLNRLVADSVRFAFSHPESSAEYIRRHAQEMDDTVIAQHIELYVNAYSENLGEQGRDAVTYLFQEARRRKIIPYSKHTIFLTE